MSGEALVRRLREVVRKPIPRPAEGDTALRHRRLMEVGREDLSLARLAEAHWDAVAILAEAGHDAEAGLLYGVWASEKPGVGLTLARVDEGLELSGEKRFLSGAGIVDRALISSGGEAPLLLDVDLRRNQDRLTFDGSGWKTQAFAETCTATGRLDRVQVDADDAVGEPGWYLTRAGFWPGACGPAACWAGGAAGLLDFALTQKRNDAHTLAHVGAMRAEVWGMGAALEAAGREIDAQHGNAMVRALTLRHLVERGCSEVLRRVARAFGPAPMAMNEDFLRRYYELDLYVRQSHAERDLEALGRGLDKR